MSADASVTHVLGLAARPGGPPLQLADECTLVRAAGHALLFTRADTRAQQLLARSQPQPRPVTAFDCCARARLLAVAAREPLADIALYSLPDKKPRGRLQLSASPGPQTASSGGSGTAAPVFEFAHIKFSRCGRRLVSLAPIADAGDAGDAGDTEDAGSTSADKLRPRMALCVWDTEALAPVPGCERGVVDVDAAFVSFDPSSADRVVVGGADGLQVWTIFALERGGPSLLRALSVPPPSPSQWTSPSRPASPSRSPSGAADAQELEDKRAQLVSHAWQPQGRVLVANRAGELLVADASAAAVERALPLATRADRCEIAGLVATTETLVLLYVDGALAWLSADGDALLRRATLPGAAAAGPVAAVASTPSLAAAFVETAGGHIFEVRTRVEPEDEDEDEDAGGSATAAPLVRLWGRSPTGAVCATAALSALGGDALLASGGVDGALALWRLATGRLAAMVHVSALFSAPLFEPDEDARTGPGPAGPDAPAPVIIAALAARAADPVLVLGDAAGRLRALCVSTVIGDGSRDGDDPGDGSQDGDESGDGPPAARAALELLPLHSVQLEAADAPLDLLALHPTQPAVLAASTRGRAVFLLSADHEQRFRPLAVLELEAPGDRVVDARWSAPAHTPHALSITCFSSSGLFLVARHDPSPASASPASASPASADSSADGADAMPVALRGKIVAFGEDVRAQCASLRLLASAAGNLMLAAHPRHADLWLVKYPAVVLDATEKISVAARAVAKDAHAGAGVSALALLPRALPNGAELAASAGADGVLTLWFLTFGGGGGGGGANGPGGPVGPVRDWQLEDVLAVKKRSVVAHAGPVTALEFVRAPGGRTLLVSAGADGLVFILDVRVDVTADGSVPRASVPRASVPADADERMMSPLYANVAAFAKYESPFRGEASAARAPPLLALARARAAEELRARRDPRKEDTRARLRELRARLARLLAENAALPADEQLARDEFVLHGEWRERRQREQRARADRVREAVERELARAAVVRARMVSEFWDSHEAHGERLAGLFPSPGAAPGAPGPGARPELDVPSFPVRRRSRGEERRAAQVELLRLGELALHRQEAAGPRAGRRAAALPPAADWLLLGGAEGGEGGGGEGGEPAGPAAAATGRDAEPTAAGAAALGLVYHPAAARTARQQRAQIWLLKASVRALAAGFNAEFAAAARLKAARMDEVEAKNARMREIQAELALLLLAGAAPAADASAAGGPEPPPAPGWAARELPASVLEASPEELSTAPYESEAARAQREAEARAARAGEAARARDDAPARALRDMMGGALDARKERPLAALEALATASAAGASASASASAPAPPPGQADDATPEQRAAAAALEAAQLRLREEQDKLRKALDLELKKLRADVAELARGFDERLRQLRARYRAARSRALAQQLYELRLGAHLAARERLEREARAARAEAAAADARAADARADAAAMAARLERARDDWQRAADEDRALDRGFARDLDELLGGPGGGPAVDAELLRALLELFRRRRPEDAQPKARGAGRPPPSASTLADAGAGAGAGLDPFADAGGASASHGARDEDAGVAPLEYERDRPEGLLVEDRVWRALNALRTRKVLAERAAKALGDALARARAASDELRARLARREQELRAARERERALRARLARLASNAPLLARVKQGQDESAGAGGLLSGVRVRGLGDDGGAAGDGGDDGDDGDGGGGGGGDEDALLVARARVEALNDVVRLHGREQVAALARIKDFRKSINVMEWEHALLALQARDADARLADLQLLRVTRELHELLQLGGDSARRLAREAALLEAKLAHMAAHRARAADKRAGRRHALEQQLQARRRENRALQDQARALEARVRIRDDICASRRTHDHDHDHDHDHRHHHNNQGYASDNHDEHNRDPHPQHAPRPRPDARLKAVAVRRKLVDLARAQTEEIDTLRRELDAMRRRTFPSFASHLARGAVD